MSDHDALIWEDRNRMGGAPCLRGSRMTVSSVLELLADTLDLESVLDEVRHRSIGINFTKEHVVACLLFAGDRIDRAAGLV